MIIENDIIKSKRDINEKVNAGTFGVVMSVYENGNFLLIEFIDKNGDTIDDGMTLVSVCDVELIQKQNN